jgi:hypothetical protein
MNLKTATIATLLSTIIMAGCERPKTPMREASAATTSNPYAFRESNAAYGKFFQNAYWDYGIDVKQGDTLWSIADELYGDPLRWKSLLENNIHIGALPDDFKPEQLQIGTRLLVYLRVSEAEAYQTRHSERNMEQWPHTTECGAFIGVNCEGMRMKLPKGDV